MTIEINDPEVLKSLAATRKVRPDATLEQIVGAAIQAMHDNDAEMDRFFDSLAPGELDRLLAEGLASGAPIDGEVAFQARRRDRRAAAARRAGQLA